MKNQTWILMVLSRHLHGRARHGSSAWPVRDTGLRLDRQRRTMKIRFACTDEEIRACFSVMKTLRRHLEESTFLERIRRQEESGYRLVMLLGDAAPVAVAGFRILENLAWGRFLYVDDLVTLPAERSRGHGAALLHWLQDHARENGCAQFHLDSGTEKTGAHRFYTREGMSLGSYHFLRKLRRLKE